jgi:hypothetical protein
MPLDTPADPPFDPLKLPSVCALSHRVFTMTGEPLFRRSVTDGAPVLVVLLGEREASIPLRSLQLEFAIDDASEDGRMLGLIAESLDYVTALRLGDKLPPEVLTGDASWEPDAEHLAIVATRLRSQLIEWFGMDPARVTRHAAKQDTARHGAAQRHLVHDAMDRAAQALNLPSRQDVLDRVESLAGELAFIEALRHRLLHRIHTMATKLERLQRGKSCDAAHLEQLTQVNRLTGIALRQIAARFDELEGQTGEIMPALRNLESQRAFIRSNRDWLYRSQRAWEPVLAEWDIAAPAANENSTPILGRSYRFLAPRFMPVTEWILPQRLRPRRKNSSITQMVW